MENYELNHCGSTMKQERGRLRDSRIYTIGLWDGAWGFNCHVVRLVTFKCRPIAIIGAGCY